MPNHPALHRIKKVRPDYIDAGMSIIAIVSPLTIVPQVVQIFQTKDVVGVSLSTWAFSAATSAIWVIYGLHHRDKPIIFNSVLGVLFCGLIAVGVLIYR